MKSSKVKNRRKKLRNYPAYGISRAQDLAKLEDGAVAALDNADNFACYAAVVFVQHITDHMSDHEWKRLYPKGDCKRWCCNRK